MVKKVRFKNFVTIRKMHKVEQRDIINDLKKEKAECEQALATERKQRFNELRKRAAEANKMIKLYRGEEQKFIEKLKEIQQVTHKKTVCSPRKNTIDTESNPNRVLQLKHMWECRSKTQSEQLEKQEDKRFPSPSVMTMLSVPKLKVRSRRQGLHS